MSTEPIDYRAVLADLKAKRDALNAAITGIEMVAMYYPSPGIQDKQFTGVQDIAPDAFFAMSIGDAIKKFLAMVKQKQPIPEIVRALELGGLQHTSKDFAATVRSALFRELRKDDPEIVKVGDDYGLTEWYPGYRKKKNAKPLPQDGPLAGFEDEPPEENEEKG